MTRKDGWNVLAVCLVLGLGTVALYSPAFSFGFVSMDDAFYLPVVPHPTHGLLGAFKAGYGNVWQPLTWLSQALDFKLFGMQPGGHHATNVILHAVNSVLVFLVLRRLTGALWRSAAVAAFFAWHPLHVEVFAWVAQRKSLLCAFFWLLTLWTYACYAENAKARLSKARFYYIGALLLFAFALLSSPAAVTLPLILLLLDWWPLGRLTATEERPAAKQASFLLVEKIPFFLVAIASSVVTYLAIDTSHGVDTGAGYSFSLRFVTAGLAYFRYLSKSIWPANLGALHQTWLLWSKLEAVAVALVLVVISVAAIRLRKTRPFWLVGWLWFLATLFPVMNLLPEGLQFMQAGTLPIADRNMYIPCIGLWMLICWEAYDLATSWHLGLPIMTGSCAVLLAACCVASSMQLQYWRNEGTLIAHIPNSSSNAGGHADYASYLMRHGQLAQAQAECEQAISISPGRPTFPVLLGEILLAEGKKDQSIEKIKYALSLDPNLDFARVELGQAYLAANRAADAAEEFKAVLHHDPRNFVAHHCLAQTLLAQGKTAAAAAEYRASLNSQINQPTTLNDLAWLLATDPHAEIRSGAEAVKLASRACALTGGKEPILMGTLAAAFAESGDFDKAVLAGQKAHDLALEQGLKALADTNLQLVALYRAHKPFRQK
jgi:Tfp pilus assembly protein PilF